VAAKARKSPRWVESERADLGISTQSDGSLCQDSYNDKEASKWLAGRARRVESFLGGISLRCCKSRRPLRKLAGRRDVRRKSTPRKSLCRFHSPGFARRNRPLPSTAPCYGPDKGAYPRHVTPSSRRTKRSCCSCTSERSFLSPGLKPRLPLAHMRARHALMQALQSGKRQ